MTGCLARVGVTFRLGVTAPSGGGGGYNNALHRITLGVYFNLFKGLCLLSVCLRVDNFNFLAQLSSLDKAGC